MVLLAAGGLFVRSLQHGRAEDLGFDPSRVVTTAIDVRADGRSTDQRAAFWTRVLDDVRRLPSTESASLTYRAPLELGVVMRAVGPAGFAPGPGRPWPTTEYAAVDTAYFHTLRIPFVEGRDFTDREIASGAPVAIVNDVLARRLWPGSPAAGKQVVSPDGDTLDVVGVVRHSKYTTVGEAPQPYLYVTRHGGNQALTLVAKSVGDSAAHLRAIAEIVGRLEPYAALYDVGTMSSRVSTSLAPTMGAASSLALIGLMALGLTALGLFGSVAYSVSRRTYEIGVRRALGAPNGSVVWLIARETVRTVSVGMASGTIAAAATAYAIRGLLYHVSPADPLAFIGAPLLLAGVCIAALAVPLHRAMRIEAAGALRYE
jgi:predicted permease